MDIIENIVVYDIDSKSNDNMTYHEEKQLHNRNVP